MEQLRKLDTDVTRKALTVSLCIGIIGTLLLGLGMSCILVWAGIWMIPGIVIGVLGIAAAAAAYPLYTRTLKKEREKATQQARKEAQMILDEARRTANAAYEELKQLKKQMRSGDVQGMNERQAQVRRNLNEAEEKVREKREQVARPKPTRAIKAGDTVELLKLGSKASVLAVNKDGTLQLQAGILKVTAKPEEVYLLENEQQPEVRRRLEHSGREFRNTAGVPELDMRGMASDEAIPVLDQFLDNAIMSKLSSARIIHGKGTGILRRAVHDHLKKSRYIKKFRLGTYGEGEDGVTIVEF